MIVYKVIIRKLEKKIFNNMCNVFTMELNLIVYTVTRRQFLSPKEGHDVVTINRKVYPLYRQGQAGGNSDHRSYIYLLYQSTKVALD